MAGEDRFIQSVDDIEIVSRATGPRTLLTPEALAEGRRRVEAGEDLDRVALELAQAEVDLTETPETLEEVGRRHLRALAAPAGSALHRAANRHSAHVARVIRPHLGDAEALERALARVLAAPYLAGMRVGARGRDVKFQYDALEKWVAERAKFTAESVARTTESLGRDQDRGARAEASADHECYEAVCEGQREAWRQMMRSAEFRALALPRRQWIAMPDACPVCDGFDGQTAAMDQDYESEDGERAYGPPLHPKCRCYEDLVEE